MQELTAGGHVELEVTPQLYRVYHANDKALQLEWVIEGTDSKLYVVPAEPGG
jgi:hypothetical protein